MDNKKYCKRRMEAETASQALSLFLEEARVSKGEPFTHTTKIPSGVYYVSEDSHERFNTLYCNAIIRGVKTTLTERPGAYSPLRVDFDFKASLDTGLKRQYTEKMLIDIIKFYQEEIKNVTNPDSFEQNMLWCIVLEKKAPRSEEGKVKDGFHLHFPNFICEPWLQDEFLKSRVTEKMLDSKMWEFCKFTEPVEKFIDSPMARKPWMMYGAGKDLTAEPFAITKAFAEDGPIDLEKIFEDDMVDRKKELKYYLPRFMSIRGYNEMTPLIAEIDARRAAYVARKPRGKTNFVKKRSMEEVLADIKIIKDGEIMTMLSDDRAHHYETWMDVGWTLFNIGQGCDEALELWIEFSKRDEKFKDGECEEQWNGMQMRDKTLGSLLSMAKSDNPDRFKEWKDANVKTFLYRSLFEDKPNEWDVAQVVYKLYKDKLLCSDSKKEVWWEFSDHRWRLMDDAVMLRRLLATEVVNLYYDLKAEIAENQRKINDDGRVKLERQEKRCKNIITGLKSCSFQNSVIKMCKVMFHDPIFARKIDENKLLWGCENGVLDLDLCLFRNGRPDDYITFSCGINYQKYSKDDDEMMELKTFFKKVFTNPNLRRYFKDTACAAMEGGNKNKTFIVGTGSGNGGKSATYNLVANTFGEYCIRFPRNILTGRESGASSAKPELARVRGKRLAMIQEASRDETINVGILKELTGNDTFFARTLFEKGADIRPMFCLWLACVTGDTSVNLPGGISMPIKSLKENSKVLAWSEKLGGLVDAKQTRFLNQGVKKCITLTLQDGTKITCTPDHRFLNSENEWVEAKDIQLLNTKLKMGVHHPSYDLENEITDFKFGNKEFTFDLKTLDGKLKAMTACRLLGYGLADGSNNRVLYIGHKLDAEQIVNDIEILTGKRPAITQNISCVQVCLPVELVRFFNELCPSQGRRILAPMILPEFIFDDECPDFLIREFVAGLFGGDGIIPCIQKSGGGKDFSRIRISMAKTNEHISSLSKAFEKLGLLLNKRFGIKYHVHKPRMYEENKSKSTLVISGDSTKIFIEKIGVRYCCHKAYRLTAVLSCKKYKASIVEQNNNIFKRTKELVEKYQKQNPKPKMSQFTKEEELIETFESSQKAQHSTGINHSLIVAACRREGTSGGFLWRFHYDTEPTIEDEPGCETMREALEQAINEQPFIYDEENLPTYMQIGNHIRRGEDILQPLKNILEKHIETTGLYKFCNGGQDDDSKVNYSVKSDSSSLPTYTMTVIGREDTGEHQVYDLTVETPYSNYMTNGIISHNCNDCPSIPGYDDATWDRVKKLDFESKFVKPDQLKQFPVPALEAEQYKMKRFKANLGAADGLNELAPALLSMLFERYKKYKVRGLREPDEVKMSTDVYRAANDVYLQFIQDKIEEVQYADGTPQEEKVFLKLPELCQEFIAWHKETHPSYSKEKFDRIYLQHEFNKKFGGSISKKGAVKGWYSYRIIEDVPEEGEGTSLDKLLSKVPEIKKVPLVKTSAAKAVPKVAAKTKVSQKVVEATLSANKTIKTRAKTISVGVTVKPPIKAK